MRAGGAPIWSPIKFAGPQDVLSQLRIKDDLAKQPDRRSVVVEHKIISEITETSKVAAA
jgi:hypothetical protein